MRSILDTHRTTYTLFFFFLHTRYYIILQKLKRIENGTKTNDDKTKRLWKPSNREKKVMLLLLPDSKARHSYVLDAYTTHNLYIVCIICADGA